MLLLCKEGEMDVEIRSLRVQIVQELAATDDLSDEILERYKRPEIQDEPVIDAGLSDDIPVINLGRLLDPQFTSEEAWKLDSACKEWGFFQLINHRIPDELIEKVKAVIEGFFRLPTDEKAVFAQKDGDIEGYGQAFVVSEEQKLDWGDMFLLRTHPSSCRKMKFWPTDPQNFRETLDMYSLEVRTVANTLFGLIGKNLGGDQKNFFGMFKSQAMRINYYPPCPNASDKVLGLSPHSDGSALTMLLQINQVQGLQIKKNGAWFPIKPPPGAFVVNIGDVLEVLSNGKYKSIEHRAIINPEKERLSIACFHNLIPGEIVGPLPELVQGSKKYYKTVSLGSFMKLFYSSKLDGKSAIDHMKIKDPIV